jgi:hypothetical protein
MLLAAGSAESLYAGDKAGSANPHFHLEEIAAVPASEAGGSAKTRRLGEDWPCFLGPRGDGVSGETGLLQVWPKQGPPVLWKKRVGEGYAAPSVRGNRLVMFHRRGDEELIDCLAADTGELLWRAKYDTRFEDPYGYNGGPRCTPILTETHCYTFGAEGRLTCVRMETGEVVWSRDTAAEFKIPRAFFGVGASPILEEDLLIVMVGGHPRSGVVAFDAQTGRTIWESVGPEDFPPAPVRIERDRPPVKLASYAAPIAATIHGKRHVLCLMRPGLISVDPRSGAVNFSAWFRSSIHDSVNGARPVVVGDQVFLSAAYETGAELLRVRPDGKRLEEVWKDLDAMQTHWSTAIHHHGYLYGFSGRHEPGSNFRCIRLADGKLMWRTHDVNEDEEPDARAGLGTTAPQFYGRGSAVLADGRFIVQAERGTLALVSVDPAKFEEISRVSLPELGYPCWTAPVLSRQRLYVTGAREARTAGGLYGYVYHLICLDLARP